MMGKFLVITSFRRFTCLGILLILFGCSGELKTYPVKGKVVFKGDGKPFQGKIYFESANSPFTRSMANTNPDGTFSLSTVKENSGSVEGEQTVRVDLDIPDSPDFKNRSKYVAIKYLAFSTYPLKVFVKPNQENFFLIEIEKP